MVQQYLEELLEQDVKFLVFCHHKVMNDGIAQVLNKCGPAHSPVCRHSPQPPHQNCKLPIITAAALYCNPSITAEAEVDSLTRATELPAS